jgi:hypothetical protein
LSPPEDWSIYQRNARHMDTTALDEKERNLMEALRVGLGHDRSGV